MSKVALITGSAVRIGHYVAMHLAKNGWDLALHYNHSQKEMAILKAELLSLYPTQRFFIVCADFGRSDHTEQVIPQVINYFGRLDLLINSASVFEPGSLKSTSYQAFLSQITINLVAPFILMRDFANHRESELIINITVSRIAHNNSDYLSYTLSKKQLWELTKMSALELSPNFRVNAIALGGVLPPAGAADGHLEKIAAKSPMKMATKIDVVLKSIDYIIDNEDLTGQLIFCDGGSHLL